MKKNLHQMYLETARRLMAAYSVDPKGSLTRMKDIEVHVLYTEKMGELNTVSKALAAFPHDELRQCRKAKLEREIGEIAGHLKENHQKDRGNER